MNIDETRNEIIRRSLVIQEKKRKQTIYIMESACAALALLFVAVLNNISIKSTEMTTTYYGTLKFGSELGAYVLVGLICFVIGILVTLISINIRKGNSNKEKTDE